MLMFLIPLYSSSSLPELLGILVLFWLPLLYFGWDQPLVLSLDIIIDKLSIILIILTIWISFIALTLKPQDNFLKLNILLLLWSLILFFSVSSLLSFFILFEVSLIPTLCIILGWGYQPERLEASYYFIFYTITLSIPLLVSILWLNRVSGMKYFHYNSELILCSGGLSFYILVVFMIKLPMFMTHFWLPKAHVEAPVLGSMLLAGILLKTGGYGVIRVFMYMKKTLVSIGFMTFGALGMVYVCILCLLCMDVKQLIAYSSVSHMNFMTIGLMNSAQISYTGSLIMMISHGLCSSLMFMLSDLVYKRSNSRSLVINKGLLMVTPTLSMLWACIVLFNMGVPPSAGSISELMIICCSKNLGMVFSLMFMLYLFLSAFYSVYMYMCMNHGNSLMSSFGLQTKEILLSVSHVVPLAGLTLMCK
nr:NADH dehydrogenase subunit 4 [Myrsidea ptilorhynchi]